MKTHCFDFVAQARRDGCQWTIRGDVWASCEASAQAQIQQEEPCVVRITLVRRFSREFDPQHNTTEGRNTGDTWTSTPAY